jgi:EAL domain-containing protein (putative c-di-GMP-specific phosphodiesterase class I)
MQINTPRIHSIVAATISLAGALDISTVAEGVESKEQAQELINMGCDEIQGYFFARPGAPEEMQRWVDGSEFASCDLYAGSGT